NTSIATTTLTPTVDVRVTKTDGRTTAVPGTQVTYTVVVSNVGGPSTATGVTLSDVMPAGLTGVTWTSMAAGGATGNTASGTGDLAETLTLPPGASVTYTVSAMITPSVSSFPNSDPIPLSNKATATIAAGTTDTDSSNNVGIDNT